MDNCNVVKRVSLNSNIKVIALISEDNSQTTQHPTKKIINYIYRDIHYTLYIRYTQTIQKFSQILDKIKVYLSNMNITGGLCLDTNHSA